jgi:hypothetical protein
MDSSYYMVPVTVQNGPAGTVRSCALYSRVVFS